MATGGSSTGVELDLAVAVTNQGKPLPPKQLKDMADELNRILPAMREFFEKADMEYVRANRVVSVKQKLYVTFCFENKDGLKSFFEASKEEDNALSKKLTAFGSLQCIQTSAKLEISEKLVFAVKMKETPYHESMAEFPDEPDEEEPNGDDLHGSAGGGGIIPTHEETPCPDITWPEEKPQNQEDLALAVTKTLAIFVPGKTAKNVKVTCATCRSLNAIQMEQSGGLWKGTYHLTKAELNIEHFFQYKAKVPYKYTRSYASYEYTSRNLLVDSIEVQRELVKGYEREGLTSHLVDILRASDHTDLKKSVMEIERLGRLNLAKCYDDHIITDVITEVMTWTYRTWLLYSVMLGVLTENRSLPVNATAADTMLTTLQSKFRLLDLPQSSMKYMPALCKKLCDCRSGKSVCSVEFVNWTFPFLDATMIKQHFSSIERWYRCSDEQHKTTLVAVCKSLWKACESHNSDAVLSLFYTLFHDHQPPLQTILTILSDIQTGTPHAPDDIRQRLISELKAYIEKRVLSEVSNAGTRDPEHYLKIWKSLRAYQDVCDLTRQTVTKAFLECLDKKRNPLTDVTRGHVKELCVCNKLLNDTSSQQVVLKKLAFSDDTRLHSLFIELLRLDSFKEAGTRCDDSVFCGWLEEARDQSSKKRYEDLQTLYMYFTQVYTLPCIASASRVQKKLTDIMTKYIQKKGYKHALKQATDITKCAEDKERAGDLFVQHVQCVLEKVQWLKPEDALDALRGANQKLILGSSATARIASVIVDIHGLKEGDSVSDTFSNISADIRFWNKVYSSEGKCRSMLMTNGCIKRVTECLKQMVHLFESKEVSCIFVEEMSKKYHKSAIQYLLVHGGTNFTDMQRLWEEAACSVKEEKDRVKLVQKVLSAVKGELTSQGTLPEGFEEVERHVNGIKEFVMSKRMTSSSAMNIEAKWKEVRSLPQSCQLLEGYVDSRVFWNVCFRHDLLQPAKETVGDDGTPLKTDEHLKTPAKSGIEENNDDDIPATEHDPLTKTDSTSVEKAEPETTLKDMPPTTVDEPGVGEKEHRPTLKDKSSTEADGTGVGEKEHRPTPKDKSSTEADGTGVWNKEPEPLRKEILTGFHGNYDTGSQLYSCTMQFLNRLKDVGPEYYRSAWDALQTDKRMHMSDVFAMMKGTELELEILIADNHHVRIEQEIKDTLLRLSRIKKYEKSVKAMTAMLGTFQLYDERNSESEFSKHISSFLKMIRTDFKSDLFADVRTAIATVCQIVDECPPNTSIIIQTLGKSSSLVDFLREIVDEDIRNLIDAVEEVSEQHVRESTVSGLIDVKGYLQPLLEYSDECANQEEDFIRLLCKQTVDPVKNIAEKIQDCSDNLHNLRSLYRNVANRGEITKEVAECVVSKGKFHFHLESENYCKFTVSYEQEKEICHSNTTLIDMRSRALLLMNTELDKQDKGDRNTVLDQFVGYIDLCTDIQNTCESLHTSGHAAYKTFDNMSEPSKLFRLKELLDGDLNSWLETLQRCKQKYYLLNFVYGDQIHSLHDYLKSEKESEQVTAILQFIDPVSTVRPLKAFKSAMKTGDTDLSDVHVLDSIGAMLHSICGKHKDFARKASFVSHESSKLSNFVQAGKLFIAELQADSSMVINTILSIYNRTLGEYPEPNQVLICSEQTTWSEIELLIERCIGSHKYFKQRKVFCLANVELLSGENQFSLIEALRALRTERHFYLAVICRGSDRHPFLNELGDFKMPVTHLTEASIRQEFEERYPDVMTVTSSVPGLGKSSWIRRHAHAKQKRILTLHVSGTLEKKRLVDRLLALQIEKSDLLHIDIGNIDNPQELDSIIFELVILRYFCAGTKAVNMRTSHVCIEIANSMGDALRNSLHTAMLFKREHLQWKGFNDFLVSREINSPVQVVCQYLDALDTGLVDRKDIQFTGKQQVKPLKSKRCRDLLVKHFASLSTDMSFSLVNIFLRFLADQLKKFSCSAFFKTKTLTEMLGSKTQLTVKSTLVKALIDVSVEFASRSVQSCKMVQQSTLKSDKTTTLGESAASRVKGMIRWNEGNHLMYVFHNQDVQTLSAMYLDKTKVPSHIQDLFQSQVGKREGLPDYAKMDQEKLQETLQHVARTNPISLKREKLIEMAKQYALTPDNLMKMVLIMLRIKANIPVIIMGETGCGKTSLIRYLAQICEVPFNVASIHAGVSEPWVIEQIMKSNTQAQSEKHEQIWLFLDEINTSEHLGVMADALCHHTCLGQVLSPKLVVMAACNPYRLRSESSILTSGLQEKIRTDELSRLVYRVLPLPEMMVDYIWDFGSLNEIDEEAYIRRMASDVFGAKDNQYNRLMADTLVLSQRFVRKIEKSDCCVSLRDVQRCRKLAKWFLNDMLKKKTLKTPPSNSGINVQIRSILMALSHCYQSRFGSNDIRQSYLKELCDAFTLNGFTVSVDDIYATIRTEQRDILERMELPQGTAKNVALQENVFVILVCILNRIPIFVVGKPGCSKSLAMQVIRSNLRGKDSKDEYFRKLPQLYCVSFQGSESSTSDGITKVFEKAENYQRSNSYDDVLSVVILDEIGLAEISRFNPLKVLHSLLEPEVDTVPNVAVVGISNWALDASKMNRAIHLSRPDMDKMELVETGKSISESFVLSKLLETTEKNVTFMTETSPVEKEEMVELSGLEQIADSYINYTREQRFKNFHGLRDYYALVKYIAKHLADIKGEVTDNENKQICLHGLQRNFQGLPSEIPNLLLTFNIDRHLVQSYSLPVTSVVKENLCDPDARHLMLITTGDAVVSILDQVLNELDRDSAVIFGSQFEEDMNDDYSYRTLSKIILHMEQGVVLILQDLENIYGSLYDMLNQNYTVMGNKRHCRIALGQYSNPICQVNKDFKCVVLVQQDNVDHTDPPFLNRFEKQFLSFRETLTYEQLSIVEDLKGWIARLVRVEGKHFTAGDIFPNFSEDMIPSLVKRCIKEDSTNTSRMDRQSIIDKCKTALLWIIKPEGIVRLTSSETSTDELSLDEIRETYFALPVHGGLKQFLEEFVQTDKTNPAFDGGCMLTIFTNSNIHTKLDVSHLNAQIDKLGVFKSEKQLQMRLQYFWLESDAQYLFIQCNVVEEEKHILLAKSLVERFRSDFQRKRSSSTMVANEKKHVCFIIHLDRNKITQTTVPQITFLSEWMIVTLDSLEAPRIRLPEFCNDSLYDFILKRIPLNQYLGEQLSWAISRIRYSEQRRNIENLSLLLAEMKESSDFISVLEGIVMDWVRDKKDKLSDKNWQVQVASDSHALYASSSLVSALEQHVVDVINKPLAMAVFELEKLGMLDTFFVKDKKSAARQEAWKKMINCDSVFSLRETPQPAGPESYQLTNNGVVLKLPFSRHLFDRVENTRDEFMKSVHVRVAQYGADSLDELENEDQLNLLSVHDYLVSPEVTYFKDYTYQGWEDDYVHDFCNIVSFSSCSSLPPGRRVSVVDWAINQTAEFHLNDRIGFVTRLHSAFWTHSALLGAVLRLVESCGELLSKEFFSRSSAQRIYRSLNTQNIVETSNEDTTTRENLVYEEREATFHHELTPPEDICETDTNLTDSLVSPQSGASPVSDDTVKPSLVAMDSRSSEESDDSSSEDAVSVPSDDEKETYSFQTLATEVCGKMLPTRQTLESFASNETWLVKTSIVLATCPQVASESQELQALRLCCDFANIFKPTDLHELAALLFDKHGIDEKCVFQCVFELIGKAVSDSKLSDLQKAWGIYFNRCLGGEDETQAMSYLFTMLQERRLPDASLSPLRQPINLAISLEYDWDDSQAFSLLDENSLSEDCSISPCVRSLNEFLCCKEPHDDGWRQLSMIVVDALDDIFRKNITKEMIVEKQSIDRLLQAHAILKSEDFSLQYAAAIAYCRSFLTRFAEYLEDINNKEPPKVTFQHLNAVIEPQSDVAAIRAMGEFCLKCLANEKTLRDAFRLFAKYEESLAFLHEVQRQEENLRRGLEGSPLSVLVEESDFSGTDKIEDIRKLIPTKRDTAEDMLRLHAFAISKFYVKRTFAVSSDTLNTTAQLLIEGAHERKMDDGNKKFLSCLLGIKDERFMVEDLNLDEESRQGRFEIASFVASVCAIVVANSRDREPTDTAFGKYMMSPTLFERKVEDNRTSSGEMNTLTHSVKCSCNYYVTFTTNRGIHDLCPICGRELQVDQKDFVIEEATLSTHSTTFSMVVFKLLRSSCLLGWVAVGYTKAIEYLQSQKEYGSDIGEIGQHLVEEIRLYRTSVGEMLSAGRKSVSLFLQIVLCETKSLIAESCAETLTPTEWLPEFSGIVDSVGSKRFTKLQGHVVEHYRKQNTTTSNVECILMEYDQIETDEIGEEMRALFRLTGNPTVAGLESELHILQLERRFPFLDLVLKYRNRLELLKHIIPLLKWHMRSLSIANYVMKRKDCTKWECLEFLNARPDTFKTNKARCDEMLLAWEKILSSQDVIDRDLRDAGLSEPQSLPRLHLHSVVKDCLIIDRTSAVGVVLRTLTHIQNTFIHEAMAIAVTRNCPALRFINRHTGKETYATVPSIPLTEVDRGSVIDFQWRDDYLGYAHPALQRGAGKLIVYDFERIENLIARDLLTNKSLLLPPEESLPEIMFKDELFKSFASMVNDLKAKLPQEPLPSEVKDRIVDTITTNPTHVMDALTHLGEILSLMKKTETDSKQSLVDYIDKWSKFLSRPFPKDVLSGAEAAVKQCHIVSLYELLEIGNAEGIIKALEEDYQKELASDYQLAEMCMRCQEAVCPILDATKTFIHRCLSDRETKDVDPEDKLIDYLEDSSFWSGACLEDGFVSVGSGKLPIGDLFPDTLLVQHIARLVERLEKIKKDIEEDSRKLTGEIKTFRKTTEQLKKEKRQKMKARRQV